MSMFTCIYCLKSEHEVEPSDAHIFPAAIGGVCSARKTVCKACNHLIGREVENPVIEKSSLFRSIWGIRGRSKRVPGVPARARSAEFEKLVFLDENGELKAPIVFEEIGTSGREAIRVVGPEERSSVIREKISEGMPLRWEQVEHTETPLLEFVIAVLDPGHLSSRRLAAKIAFERWAKTRSSELLADGQYDCIRDFIISGKETEIRCGVLVKPPVLSGFSDLPVGNHAVGILQHTASRILGAFVTLFSLFYFCILISTKYRCLKSDDDFLIVNPQARREYNPRLRAQVGDLLVPWGRLIEPYRKDPETIVAEASAYAIEKFNEAAREELEKAKAETNLTREV